MNDRTPDPATKLEARREQLAADLATKIAQTRGPTPKSGSGWGEAMKIASEFVAGIVVGVGLGLIFDRVLGTSPIGLVVFLMLGFAAGVLNVLRTQGVVPDAGAKLLSGPPKGGTSGAADQTPLGQQRPDDEDETR